VRFDSVVVTNTCCSPHFGAVAAITYLTAPIIYQTQEVFVVAVTQELRCANTWVPVKTAALTAVFSFLASRLRWIPKDRQSRVASVFVDLY
jgi:hypothetical protein